MTPEQIDNYIILNKPIKTFRQLAEELNLSFNYISNRYYYHCGRVKKPRCYLVKIKKEKPVKEIPIKPTKEPLILRYYNQEDEMELLSKPVKIVMPDYFPKEKVQNFSEQDIMKAIKTRKHGYYTKDYQKIKRNRKRNIIKISKRS